MLSIDIYATFERMEVLSMQHVDLQYTNSKAARFAVTQW
jgi:hypothetical protein